MQQFVRKYVEECEICGERKDPTRKKRYKLQTYLSCTPFERIATDIAGPLSITEDKSKYILVIGDDVSELTAAYAIPDIQTTTIANVLVRS